MPSAVAEAEAAARYVADVWRLITASRLQNSDQRVNKNRPPRGRMVSDALYDLGLNAER